MRPDIDTQEKEHMLFVAEYEVSWESLDAAVAKRLEWDEVRPEGFRFVAEYVWLDRDPPFRGVAIFEADDVEAFNTFALHYGPTVTMRAHPASDVVSAIGAMRPDTTSPRPRKPASKRKGRR